MQKTKPWWASKTVLGAVATSIIGIAALFQINLSDLSDDLVRGLEGLALLITTGLTIYGRIKARHLIGSPTSESNKI